MKSEKIVLCLAVGLTAFGASLGLLEIGNYLKTALTPVRTEPKPPPLYAPVVQSPPIPDFKQPVFSPDREAPPPEIAPAEPEEEPLEMGEDGDYYIILDKPKGFEDFENLRIETVRYDEKLEKLVKIKPTGLVEAKRQYRFSWLNIAGKRISLITKTRRGVSYQFDGKFIENGEEITYKTADGDEFTDFVVLKGRLTKWSDGKKIAEAKVKFAIYHGC